MKLKHLFFAFTAMMLCFATPAFAQNLAGEGTEANPYQIGSLNDLITFRNSVNNGETKYNADGVYVALAADIDMASEDWSVNIGDDCNNTFDGIFDGKGYTLYNLNSTETAKKADEYICTGLFAAIGGNAVIKNVTIQNVNIATNVEGYKGNNVSAVVGFAWAATGSIENVTVKGNISINAPNATGVGAILGYAYGSSLTIKDCKVEATTSGNILGAAYVGGIIGYASSNSVMNNNTVDNVIVEGVSVAGVAGIMLGGCSADANTVKNVSLKIAEEHKALWTNSAAIVAGTITGGYVTVSNTNYENVKADGKATDVIVGGILVEKPTSPIAAVEICVGNKYYSTNKLQGEGTEANPYKISSLADLILFRNSVNKGEKTYNAEGVYVALTADIDLASVENWEPIGTFDYSFDGNFNGNGKVIKNLKMSSNAAAGAEVYLGFFGVTANNVIENLTIENVTVKAKGQIVSAAIGYPYYTTVNNVKVCGDIKIEGGNYTAGVLGYTRLCVNASNLTVEGAEGSYIKGARVVGGVIADIQMNHGLKANYSNFSVSGVAIDGTNMVGGISGILATQTLNGATVKNVTLTSGDGRVGIVAGCFGGTCTLTDVEYEDVDGATAIIGPTYKENKAVEARIGDTYYSTLQDALAGEGDEVVLLAPVTIAAGEEVVLDLKGKTVSQTVACTGNYNMIYNKGNLTIKNGTISFTDSGEGDPSFGWGSYTVRNDGTLLVENATIEHLGAQNANGVKHMYCALYQYSGSSIINSGKISTPTYRSARLWKGDMTINGGDFEGQLWVQAVDNTANLTINGGTFAPRGNDGSSVYVSNGTYSVDFAVTGGKFETKIGVDNAEKLAGAITGGSFSKAAMENTNPALLADGLAFGEADANGYYGVEEKEEKVTLPEVAVTDIKSTLKDSDPDLTFALNFAIKDVENLTEDYLEKLFAEYGSWYTDYVLTISGLSQEGVTFNANGDADGYLAGQYDAWSENWVSVPFEDVTIKNGESLYIMEYAAKLMGQSGLRFTLQEIAEIVQNFDCGVYFTPEFLAANPNMEVSLQLVVFKEDENGVKTFYGENGYVANNNFSVANFDAVVTADGKQSQYFASFAEAVAAAEDGATVTLLSNVELASTVKVAGKAITLDLAGKTVSGVCSTSQQALVCVENNASLTVKDTAGEGKITFAQGASNVGWTVDVKGNFTLESGKIELTGSWSIGYAVEVRPNSWGTEYQNASIFTMNGGEIVSSDGGVRVASSSAAGHKKVAASFVMNGGKIDAAWDGVFVQQSDAIYDVLNFTINDGTIESDLNPVRVYGPAATGYVNGKECMNIAFNGGTMNYTGAEAREWVIDGILRVGGGSTLETILESGSINASAEFAENNELPAGYEWAKTENGIYTIESTTLVIDDREGKPFVNPTAKELTKLTYIRQFSSNTARDLFVPFEIPVEKLTEAGYEVYRIYAVLGYDDNKDMVVDRLVMNNVKITEGTLLPNYPYIIRRLESTEEETLTLTLEDVTLYSSENLNNVTCSTADIDFAVNGTYSAMSVEDLNGRLVVGGGKWGTLAEGSIKPYRLHMTLTPKATAYNTISEQAMKSITMSTVGEELEDGTTVIYDVQMENNAPEGIYDLQGRRVVEPKKGGLYIVNGKKVIF